MLYKYVTHVGALDNYGDYSLISIEYIRQFALGLEAHLRYSIDSERIASNDVDYLVLLIPTNDTWILGSVQRQVRFFRGHPSQHSTLPKRERQRDFPVIGYCRKISRTWVSPRCSLVKVCVRVMCASVASRYFPGTAAGSSV